MVRNEAGGVGVLDLLHEAAAAGESVPVWMVSKVIGCSSSQLVEAAGRCSGNRVLDEENLQAYLRDLIAITWNVYDLTESLPKATAWLRAEPLPEFDGLTAMDVIAAGRAANLARLIDIYAAGPAG